MTWGRAALPALVVALLGAGGEPVSVEEVCPTTPPTGFRVWVGHGQGSEAEALRAARQDAHAKALAAACAGQSELRCAAIRQNLRDWREGHWTKRTGAACATVALRASLLDTLDRDAAQFETDVGALAARIGAAGGDLIALEPIYWASGCPAGETGAAILSVLRAKLGRQEGLRLVAPGEKSAAAATVRLELGTDATGVQLHGAVRQTGEAWERPIEGFRFPLDLFATAVDEVGACRSDRALGLEDGERPGRDGLRVNVGVFPDTGGDALFCEGDRVEPVVSVNQPARVKVWSVAQDGRALLVWPPPGGDGAVDGSISLGELDLVSSETGDERLVAVAVARGGTFGPIDRWTGFCALDGAFGSDYPAGAAVGTATLTVLPPGGVCPDGVSRAEAARAALAAVRSCGAP